MNPFAQGILAGCFAALGGVALVYAAIASLLPASFPAPAITPVAALDEKLRFLRRNPDLEPRVLAVGSSITFRQLVGTPFEGSAGGPRQFLNGATNALKIHQTRDLLEFYLSEFDRVHTVIMMTGLPDFQDCTGEPARLFDHDDAKAYAFGDWPAAYFYFRYFSPQRFAASAADLAGRTTPLTGDMYLDAHGSAPLQLPDSMLRGLRYQQIAFDSACIDHLVDLSAALHERGLRLKIVFPPLHPEYRRSYPETVPATCRIARQVSAATRNHKTDLLIIPHHKGFGERDFYDAFHLQHAAVQRLSAKIARWMGRAPPPDATAAEAQRIVAELGPSCEVETVSG